MGEEPHPGAEVVRRLAVRAIVVRQDQLLLLHATATGGYKFPGGGVEGGEDDVAALSRELAEECGRPLVGITGPEIVVIETRPAADRTGALFLMESRYYRCGVGEPDRDTRLEDYERRLGLEPAWVTVEDAIAEADRVLRSGAAPAWVSREREVLRVL